VATGPKLTTLGLRTADSSVATMGTGQMYLNNELLSSVSVAQTQDYNDKYLQAKVNINIKVKVTL
jgi:hypothetical protein